MQKIDIKRFYEGPDDYSGAEVVVCGWVRTIRSSKFLGFIELNDGSCLKSVQLVLDKEALEGFDEIVRLNVGSAIEASGVFTLTPDAKQPFEIRVTSVRLEGASTPDYPLQKKRHSMEFLRQIAYLRPRTNTFNAVFRLRSEISFAIHEFFNSRGFVYVHTPIITASDCEGAGEMFRITTLPENDPPRLENGDLDYSQDFFGKAANLTVSGQLEAETFALAFGKCYTFGPTFRAEKSNTTRHAAEFWMVEPEMAFADLNDDMDLAEDMIKHLIRHALYRCPQEMEFFNKFMDDGLIDRLQAIAQAEFARITYTEAIEMLEPNRDKFDYPISWGCDLQTEHERFLTEQVLKKPVFVTGYPKEIKAFYMRLNDDNKTVAAMDLLVPGVGEIIGGSQREERLDVLNRRIEESGMKTSDYWWYTDLRKYGGTRHCGFGLGLDRVLMYISGVSNIRDTIPYPRTPGFAEF